jgi:hypothetical protein
MDENKDQQQPVHVKQVGNSMAWQIVLGLVLFFFVLPMATCAGCVTCMGTAATIHKLNSP